MDQAPACEVMAAAAAAYLGACFLRTVEGHLRGGQPRIYPQQAGACQPPREGQIALPLQGWISAAAPCDVPARTPPLVTLQGPHHSSHCRYALHLSRDSTIARPRCGGGRRGGRKEGGREGGREGERERVCMNGCTFVHQWEHAHLELEHDLLHCKGDAVRTIFHFLLRQRKPDLRHDLFCARLTNAVRVSPGGEVSVAVAGHGMQFWYVTVGGK